MQNHTQITLIQRWERDHYRLGNTYKNKLAKKSVEVVERELAKLAEDWKNMTFSKHSSFHAKRKASKNGKFIAV